VKTCRVTRENYTQFREMLKQRVSETHPAARPLGADEHSFFARYGVLDGDTFWVFAAEHEGRFCGWISAALIPKPDARLGTIYIDELWVCQEYRRQQVATQLVGKVLETAGQMGIWRVRLNVSVSNQPARELYRSIGFRESDTCIFCEIDVRKSYEELEQER